jgi:hypothetical protein
MGPIVSFLKDNDKASEMERAAK